LLHPWRLGQEAVSPAIRAVITWLQLRFVDKVKHGPFWSQSCSISRAAPATPALWRQWRFDPSAHAPLGSGERPAGLQRVVPHAARAAANGPEGGHVEAVVEQGPPQGVKSGSLGEGGSGWNAHKHVSIPGQLADLGIRQPVELVQLQPVSGVQRRPG